MRVSFRLTTGLPRSSPRACRAASRACSPNVLRRIPRHVSWGVHGDAERCSGACRTEYHRGASRFPWDVHSMSPRVSLAVAGGVRRESRDMSWVCRCGCQVTCAGGVFDQPFDLIPVEPRIDANEHECRSPPHGRPTLALRFIVARPLVICRSRTPLRPSWNTVFRGVADVSGRCYATCAGGIFDRSSDLTSVEPRIDANRHESDLSGVRRDGGLRFVRQRFWRDHVVFGQRALSYLAACFALRGRDANWVSGTPLLRPSGRDMT
jgi:hypothetical protein